MPPVPGETVLNQMKKSDRAQVTTTLSGAGSVVIPFAADRVSLVIGPHPTTALTLSFNPGGAADPGIVIPAGSVPLVLSLATSGSIVKGPLYAVGAAIPATITFWESINSAP